MHIYFIVLDTSQTFIQKQMQSLESQTATFPSFQPITDSQVALARLHKTGHRPLGRTQSAPLPLGHPMLNNSISGQQLSIHYEDYGQIQHNKKNLKQVHFIKILSIFYKHYCY